MDDIKMNCSKLPVDVVFAPDWWYYHTGLTFDEDFFYDPRKRVESERRMEDELYERFGEFGLGKDHGQDKPVMGAVHLAAGFLIQEMLGCPVEYRENAPPQVIPADLPEPVLPSCDPFSSPVWFRLEKLMDSLEGRFGYLTGDVNWGGVLNIALDLRGQDLFLDMMDKPEQVSLFFSDIARVIEAFTSLSVNNVVGHLPGAVFLHSQCSHTMISVEDYRRFLMPFDLAWSQSRRPYGIHFCGSDPHRFAKAFAELPRLDFLDVGWGGDISELRRQLPDTFLNIRMDPVSLVDMKAEKVKEEVKKRVNDSFDSGLTGVCCVNMDHTMPDENVRAVLSA